MLCVMPVSPRLSMARVKDRLSYNFRHVSIDLTQVTSENNKVHELELEMDTKLLLKEARLAQEQQENDYEEMVGVFLMIPSIEKTPYRITIKH